MFLKNLTLAGAILLVCSTAVAQVNPSHFVLPEREVVARLTEAGAEVVGAVSSDPQDKSLLYVREVRSWHVEDDSAGTQIALLAKLTRLESLSLGGKALDDSHLELVGPLPKLKYFSVAAPKVTSAAAIGAIKDSPGLQSLGFARGTLQDESLGALTSFEHLESLVLSRVEISDRAMEAIGKLTRLKSLNLSYSRFSDAVLAELVALKSLHRLVLSYSTVTNEALATIGRMKQLEILRLDGLPLTNADLEALRPLSNLRALSLRSTQITYESSRTLKEMFPNSQIAAPFNKVTLGH